MLLNTTVIVMIAVAMSVIVTIKQSPFFFSIHSYYSCASEHIGVRQVTPSLYCGLRT